MKISSGSGPRAESEGDGWIPNVGVEPAYRGNVKVMYRNGRYDYGSPRRFYWGVTPDPNPNQPVRLDYEILQWRPYGNP